MNFKTKNTKTKALIAALIAVALLFVATFAYFTDRATFVKEISGATFGINVESVRTDTVIMPQTDFSHVKYSVTNEGQLDAIVRETFVLFGVKDGVAIPVEFDGALPSVYFTGVDLPNASREIGNVSMISTRTEYTLASGETVSYEDMVVGLAGHAGNEWTNADIYAVALIEAKQEGTGAWETVATETLAIATANEAEGLGLDLVALLGDDIAGIASVEAK